MSGIGLRSAGSAEVDGRALAERVRDRDQGRDARFETRMRLVDRQGGVRERRFTTAWLRSVKGEDKGLVRFLAPGDIRGTGLLVLKHGAGEAERFLFLPALGRVRRVAGGESQEAFVGSDFSYEDIGGQDLDAYTYQVLDDQASFQAGDGKHYVCFKLEAKAKDARAPHPTTVSWVVKDSLVVVHSEFFDRAGQKRKTYDVRKIAAVQGIWTVLESVMATERDRTRTELVVDTPKYNVGLTDADVSRRELERPTP